MNTVSMSSGKSPATDGTTGFSLSKQQTKACCTLEGELAQVLQTDEAEHEICIGSVHRGRKDMFGIFTSDAASGYTPILLDPHTTSPGQEGSAIVRNDQKDDGSNRESEIYHRARRIYYRGRRTSLRRGSGII